MPYETSKINAFKERSPGTTWKLILMFVFCGTFVSMSGEKGYGTLRSSISIRKSVHNLSMPCLSHNCSAHPSTSHVYWILIHTIPSPQHVSYHPQLFTRAFHSVRNVGLPMAFNQVPVMRRPDPEVPCGGRCDTFYVTRPWSGLLFTTWLLLGSGFSKQIAISKGRWTRLNGTDCKAVPADGSFDSCCFIVPDICCSNSLGLCRFGCETLCGPQHITLHLMFYI